MSVILYVDKILFIISYILLQLNIVLAYKLWYANFNQKFMENFIEEKTLSIK